MVRLKWKTERLYDVAISYLDTYPEELNAVLNRFGTTKFIAPLSRTVKKWQLAKSFDG